MYEFMGIGAGGGRRRVFGPGSGERDELSWKKHEFPIDRKKLT